MKKLMITVAFFSSIMLSCSSQRTNSSVSISNDEDGKRGKTTVTVNDEHGSVSFVTNNDIVFNDDETAIERFVLTKKSFIYFN